MSFDVATYEPLLLEDVEAAQRLIENGWVQECASDGLRFCLFGAVREVTRGWDNNLRYQRLHNYVLAHLPDGMSLAEWNDAPGRTQEDVVLLLESCKA